MRSTRLATALTVVISLFIGYVLCEVAWRRFNPERISAEEHYDGMYQFWAVGAPLLKFDAKVGFRYVPNTKTYWRFFSSSNELWLKNAISINNAGRPGRRDDKLDKEPGEFRIGIFGDSFTAGITNNVPWPDFLEDELNADEDAKRRLGVQHFKVINFGQDGTGVEQFRDMFNEDGRYWNLDLTMVNFITGDLGRPYAYRDDVKVDGGWSKLPPYTMMLNCLSLPVDIKNPTCKPASFFVIPGIGDEVPNDLQIFKKAVARWYLSQRTRQWWQPTLLMELFHRYGITPPSTAKPSAATVPGDGSSSEALVEMARQSQRMLVLHNPVWWNEFETDNAIPTERLNALEASSGQAIVTMMCRLPVERGRDDIMTWLNAPRDGHWSDKGAALYAQAVSKVVIQTLIDGKTPRIRCQCTAAGCRGT